MTAELPDLLYVGDVPVESTYHGSALLYRLLRNYPAHKLRIIETGSSVSQATHRLPQVSYASCALPGMRWLNTRFQRLVSLCFTATAPGLASAVPSLLAGFHPAAILTVAHGYGWLAACRYARKHHLPLYLIVHDDWPRTTAIPPVLLRWLDRVFGRHYRGALVRLCVSPFMSRRYHALYGVESDVLYPSRGMEGPVFQQPPRRLASTIETLRVAFAGTLDTGDYWETLRVVAEVLEEHQGELLVFGPLDKGAAATSGLLGRNIRLRGFIPSHELITVLRDEADVLLLPMSFDDPFKSASVAFPSKLTDYTAAALPLLIVAPETSSAVMWARENPGVALVVNRRDKELLSTALARLAADASLRHQLAATACTVGERLFSSTVAQERFYSRLAG